MNRDDLIRRSVELHRMIKDLEVEMRSIDASLIGDSPRGTEFVASTGEKIRVCSRAVLVADMLKSAVSPQVWTTITERKPVADLIKYAMRKGKITEDIYAECCIESKKWIEEV